MVEELEGVHMPALGDTKAGWGVDVPVQSVQKGVTRSRIHRLEEVQARVQVQVQRDHLVHQAYDVLPKACQRYFRKPHSSRWLKVQV
jgi:hypothetical protein